MFLGVTVVSSLVTMDAGAKPDHNMHKPRVLRKKSDKFLGSVRLHEGLQSSASNSFQEHSSSAATSSNSSQDMEMDMDMGPRVDRRAREDGFIQTVKAFKAAGIKFVTFGGGALGMIRDGRMPPHDDDVDFLVPSEHFAKATGVLGNLKYNGHKGGRPHSGKVSLRMGPWVTPHFLKARGYGWGPVEVWKTTASRNANYLCVPHWKTVIPASLFFPARMVTTKIPGAGGLTVPVPKNPQGFVKHFYGPNWRTPSGAKPNNFNMFGPPPMATIFSQSCGIR